MGYKDILMLLNLNDNILNPKLKNLGVVYEVDDTLFSQEQIKEYEEEGLLVSVGTKSYPSCKVCNDTALTIIIQCPSCKSSMLEKYDLLIHYECNTIAPIEEFDIIDGNYICPKCKKRLNKIGIDYGNPGLGFICLKCNNLTQYPLVIIRCSNDHISSPYELNTINFKSYRLSEKCKSLIKMYDEFMNASKILRGLGFDVKIMNKVKSKDKSYIIPLIINDDIIVDYIPNMLNDEELSKLLSMLMNIDAKRYVIIVEAINDRLSGIFNDKKVRVVTRSERMLYEVIIDEVNTAVAKL